MGDKKQIKDFIVDLVFLAIWMFLLGFTLVGCITIEIKSEPHKDQIYNVKAPDTSA